jgi:hypothetical protein
VLEVIVVVVVEDAVLPLLLFLLRQLGQLKNI